MSPHQRYASVPAHLLAAALRDDVERLPAEALLALSHWIGDRVSDLIPAAAVPAFQVFHVVGEAPGVTTFQIGHQARKSQQ